MKWTGLLVLYVLGCSFLLFVPLSLHPASHLPDDGDALQATWMMAWASATLDLVLEELGEVLGDAHDLAVLEERLAGAEPSALLERYLGELRQRRTELVGQAAHGMHETFAEPPERLLGHIADCWQRWKS